MPMEGLHIDVACEGSVWSRPMVKNKTKSQDKEGISKFLDTLTKQEVNELRKIFEQYFISEQYNIIAKQIFKALSINEKKNYTGINTF